MHNFCLLKTPVRAAGPGGEGGRRASQPTDRDARDATGQTKPAQRSAWRVRRGGGVRL